MKRAFSVSILVLLAFAVASCATSKYKTMYAITDWTYLNHSTLLAQYANATPEDQAWLRKNVNPYMNMMQQAVIAMSAIDANNNVKASECASKITYIATGVKYDASRVVQAILARDYDTLFVESLVLKDLIIRKMAEKKGG